ncbi:hypothetical protein [Streptomyces griseus]|uniref:hypothetical protein n=1 Tax=Streptomyces griseus TaxID=1911 RepID=UPI00084025D3|nr:hypothetical protein [Streptomyces griseus]
MTLTRGARITGAVLCAVLGVITAGWIVRDLRAAGDPADLLRHWAGYTDVRPAALPATSQGDLVLLLVPVLVAFAALRSRVAASALVATGVVTLVLRLPGVWGIGASWTDGRYSDELRTRALIGTFVTLAAALALIVTGSAGRAQPADGYEPLPTRPGPGAGVTAFLVLGASGAVLIAWEIRHFLTLPARFHPDRFTGGPTVPVNLVGAPPGWSGVALALLCGVVALTALLRAVHARPLGMIAAGFLLLSGVLGIARAVHLALLDHFGDLPAEHRLAVLTSFLLAFTGAAALLVLARRGLEEDRPGHGYPPQGPAGYGHPQGGQPGGGFGPPPPASPPPGW